jgi:hypothetical protein
VWEGVLPVDARGGGRGGGGGFGGDAGVARSGANDTGDGEVSYEGVGEAAELWMIWLVSDRQR